MVAAKSIGKRYFWQKDKLEARYKILGIDKYQYSSEPSPTDNMTGLSEKDKAALIKVLKQKTVVSEILHEIKKNPKRVDVTGDLVFAVVEFASKYQLPWGSAIIKLAAKNEEFMHYCAIKLFKLPINGVKYLRVEDEGSPEGRIQRLADDGSKKLSEQLTTSQIFAYKFWEQQGSLAAMLEPMQLEKVLSNKGAATALFSHPNASLKDKLINKVISVEVEKEILVDGKFEKKKVKVTNEAFIVKLLSVDVSGQDLSWPLYLPTVLKFLLKNCQQQFIDVMNNSRDKLIATHFNEVLFAKNLPRTYQNKQSAREIASLLQKFPAAFLDLTKKNTNDMVTLISRAKDPADFLKNIFKADRKTPKKELIQFVKDNIIVFSLALKQQITEVSSATQANKVLDALLSLSANDNQSLRYHFQTAAHNQTKALVSQEMFIPQAEQFAHANLADEATLSHAAGKFVTSLSENCKKLDEMGQILASRTLRKHAKLSSRAITPGSVTSLKMAFNKAVAVVPSNFLPQLTTAVVGFMQNQGLYAANKFEPLTFSEDASQEQKEAIHLINKAAAAAEIKKNRHRFTVHFYKTYTTHNKHPSFELAEAIEKDEALKALFEKKTSFIRPYFNWLLGEPVDNEKAKTLIQSAKAKGNGLKIDLPQPDPIPNPNEEESKNHNLSEPVSAPSSIEHVASGDLPRLPSPGDGEEDDEDHGNGLAAALDLKGVPEKSDVLKTEDIKPQIPAPAGAQFDEDYSTDEEYKQTQVLESLKPDSEVAPSSPEQNPEIQGIPKTALEEPPAGKQLDDVDLDDSLKEIQQLPTESTSEVISVVMSPAIPKDQPVAPTAEVELPVSPEVYNSEVSEEVEEISTDKLAHVAKPKDNIAKLARINQQVFGFKNSSPQATPKSPATPDGRSVANTRSQASSGYVGELERLSRRVELDLAGTNVPASPSTPTLANMQFIAVVPPAAQDGKSGAVVPASPATPDGKSVAVVSDGTSVANTNVQPEPSSPKTPNPAQLAPGMGFDKIHRALGVVQPIPMASLAEVADDLNETGTKDSSKLGTASIVVAAVEDSEQQENGSSLNPLR